MMIDRWIKAFPALLLALSASAAAADDIFIPHEVFQLDNGLTVVVHEDRKAPIVAVNLWYHVGSKDEPPGRSGFAHLFEHLMFQGTENHPDDYFIPLQQVGATEINGTTGFDRTNYFQNVPTPALDLALWMESERMGHFLGALDQAMLDEQREVVKNEKRQTNNQPYGEVFRHLVEGVFPTGHPYSWLPIGSMADLDAADLDDARDWFNTYYGPNNAVLVLAGDIDVDTAREKVALYFGDIAPGPPLDRVRQWIPRWEQPRRKTMTDRVPQARLYRAWPAPSWGTAESAQMSLLGALLTSGTISRLHQRLVYDEQVATDVGHFYLPGEISGLFVLWATVQPDGDIADVERLVDEELAKLQARGPAARELERVKMQARASFIRGIERVGGFGGKSDILAEHMVYGGDPALYRRTLQWTRQATRQQVRDLARDWLNQGMFTLEVQPFAADLRAAAAGADRSRLPYPEDFPDIRFPELERATLDNGLEVIVAQRPAVPVIQLGMQVNAGYAADQFKLPGTASAALSMLTEGTKRRSALAISEQLQLLGARARTSSTLDASTVSFSMLREHLDASLELFADLVLNPAFPADELERVRRQMLAAIQREKVTPQSMALRVLPQLLYGQDHAYGLPLTGSGDEQSIATLTRAQLEAFHRTWFRPNNATLIIVGDTTMDEMLPRLERVFGHWQPGDVPVKNISYVSPPDHPRLYLLDRPGSTQSLIIAGKLMPPYPAPDELALEAVNGVLGGSFVSRLNMNLREDKGWSYGVRSHLLATAAQRPWLVVAPVQSDRTAEAVREIQSELANIAAQRPITEQELETHRRNRTLTLPGRWETAASVLGSIGEIVRFDLPDDYWEQYAHRVRDLSLEASHAAVREHIDPQRLLWVIVGDRAEIEASLHALDLGPIELLDADGRPIAAQRKTEQPTATGR